MGNETISIVNSYTYLGVTFTPSGKFKTAKQELLCKSKKVTGCLLQTFNHGNGTDVKTLIKLFDSNIKPVMLYGAEIWSLADINVKDPNVSIIEKMFFTKEKYEMAQAKFCKHILGVPYNASNLLCLSEIGRYPLIITNIVQTCKFIIKLKLQSNEWLSRIALCHYSNNSITNNLSRILNDLHILQECRNIRTEKEGEKFIYSLKTKLQQEYNKSFLNFLRNNEGKAQL